MTAPDHPSHPTVAIQGERGAFSHEAAIRLAGPAVEIHACRSFDDVFDAVTSGRVEMAVVPVENTLAGAVQRPVDLLTTRDVHAVAETKVPIRLCLVAAPGTKLGDVRKAASHPVALAQCLRFFRAHPDIEPTAVYDTAGSIRDLMTGGAVYQAAIGSSLAAELYGAEVLASDLEDEPENYTRFVAIRRAGPISDVPRPKTMLAFTLANVPGALHTALGYFVAEGLDLERLESRPIPGRPWVYRFLADVRGGDSSAHDRAIEALRRSSPDVRLLGRFTEDRPPTG